MTQEVTVPVPIDRVPEFYRWFGSWLLGVTEKPAPESVVDHQPWTSDDTEKALEVSNKLSVTARKIVDLLIDHPGARLHWNEIAERLEIEKGKYGIAGALAWPGRHSYAVNREMPVRFESAKDGTYYWMEPIVAKLFGRVRSK